MKSELNIVRNEGLRKIGRNILLFQKMESLLKYLILNSKITYISGENNESPEQRYQSYRKQTMGQLVRQFLKNCLSEDEEIIIDEPADLKKVYIHTSFQIKSDESLYQTIKQNLALVLSERNELVHHLLPKFNFDKNLIENWKEIDCYLDRQHNKIIPQYNFLKKLFENIQKNKKKFFDIISSDEYIDLITLQGSRLAVLLETIKKRSKA